MTKQHVLALACMLVSTRTIACEDVIALSKTISTSVVDEATHDQQSRDFCSEYSKHGSKANTGSLGGSYGGSSLNAGSSSASTNALAQKTCDKSDSSKVAKDAYKQYVETIAEGAYPAYEACVRARAVGITIKVTSALEHKMSVAVVNATGDQGYSERIFAFQGEANTTCHWGSGGLFSRRSIAIPGDGTRVLTCERSDSSTPSAVTVFAETRGDYPLSFPWGEYLGGKPVQDLLALKARLDASEAALAAMKGSVVAFDAADCPAGWIAYAPAQGRFIRGIDKAATTVDPDGLRKPGAIQAQAVGPH